MISIIIPTWNEESSLAETLACVQAEHSTYEVIIVDGGSTDETVALARQQACLVIESDRRQRAYQLNLGAARAQGDILWFLHADTWFPPGTLERIAEALSRPEIIGGGFARRFRSASPLLWLTCWFAQLRSRWCGLYFGDQALYVRAESFHQLGGFRELQVFEDFDFCLRLRATGKKLQLLKPPIRTSARRFAKRGALWVTLHDCWLSCRFLAKRRNRSKQSQ